MPGRLGGSHNRPGRGNIQRLVNKRGYVTFRGRVTRDGRTHYAQAVGAGTPSHYSQKAWVILEREARDQARGHLDELVADLDRDRVPDTSKRRATLGDWLVEWKKAKLDALPAETPTWERYEYTIRLHIEPFLSGARLSSIGQAAVLRWRRELLHHREQPRSVRNVREAERLLREILRDAPAQGYEVDDGVFKMRHLADPNKETKEPARSLTPADFVRLLDHAPEPRRTAWMTCYLAVCRIGEARALRWGRVLWTERQVDVSRQLDRSGRDRVPKWGSAGVVDAPKELFDALRAHHARQEAAGVPVGPDDYVFFDRTLRKVPTYWQFLRWLKEDLRAAGLPDAGTHVLRHGAGWIMAEVESNPLNIQHRMRHRNLRTTEVYTRKVPGAGRKTASKVAQRLKRERIG